MVDYIVRLTLNCIWLSLFWPLYLSRSGYPKQTRPVQLHATNRASRMPMCDSYT